MAALTSAFALYPAFDAMEDRLAITVLRCDVTALMAGLAGIGGGDDDKTPAIGVHLVLEPFHQTAPIVA